MDIYRDYDNVADCAPARLIPAAVKGTKSTLSPSGIQAARQLSGPRPLRFTMQALFSWASIFIAIFIARRLGGFTPAVLAIIVIATRMNILALLVHEQAHGLGFRGRWGNLFANALTAYPLLVLTVEGYAQVHLAHHKYYFSERDPDIKRKTGVDWTFPMGKRKLVFLFLSDISGLSVVKIIKGKKIKSEEFKSKNPSPRWARFAFLGILFSVLTIFGGWQFYLVFWIIPLVTIFPMIVRIGAISEHVYIPNGELGTTSPLIIPRWWEKAFLPNLNFTYHIYHHWHPGVSFGNLPAVHAIYQSENMVDENNVFHGYTSYFRFLQSEITNK